MANKKRKNKLIPLISLLCVFAVLMGGYYALKAYNEKLAAESETEEPVSSVSILKKDSAILTAFSYTLGEETLEFSFENEKWVYVADKYFPVATKVVSSMVSGMTDIKAVSKLDIENADLAEYGLDTPSSVVYCKYSDGTEYTFNFGDKNSFNGYQYFNVSGSPEVYMVETTIAGAFTKELNALYEAEVWPLLNDTVASEDITSIVINTAGGQTNTIEYPETVEILFNLMYKLDLGTWEDYYASENEMGDFYGLKADGDRVTINYNKPTSVKNEDGSTTEATVPASYTVYFGNEFEIENSEDGARKFFYTQQGSTVVYSADKETADKIFEYITYVPPVVEETEAE